MSPESPIYMEDYGVHNYAVHCFEHSAGDNPWTFSIEVFLADRRIFKSGSDPELRFATYDAARVAGKEFAERTIDKIEGGIV